MGKRQKSEVERLIIGVKMNNNMNFTRYFILILIFCVMFAGTSKSADETLKAIEFTPDLLLQTLPSVQGFDGAKAILKYETVIPTPATRVYYGTMLADQDLAYPRYRRNVSEEYPTGVTESRVHEVKIDISKLESVQVDVGLVESLGGIVTYRVEIFDPRISSTRLYDGRFRYKRSGKSKEDSYQLDVAITAGPIVDMVTADSAIISWETDQPTMGKLEVDDKIFLYSNVARRHEVKVKQLSSDTKYTYRISCFSDWTTPRYSFRTAPRHGSQKPFKFGFMSDSRAGVGAGERSYNGVNYKDLSRFVMELYRQEADFILFGGDLVNGYTSNQQDFSTQLQAWQKAVEPVAHYIPIYEAMGNHEIVCDFFEGTNPAIDSGEPFMIFSNKTGLESSEAHFAAQFVNPIGSAYGFPPPRPEKKISGLSGAESGPSYAENVYSFNYGNIHFVAFNTNYWYTGAHGGSPTPYKKKYADKAVTAVALNLLGGNREGYIRENQMEWIKRDLAAAQADPNIDWIFLFAHEPAFPNGGHVYDAMFWGTNGHGEEGGLNDKDVPLGDVVDMRDRFWQLVSQHDKVLAVLFGDEHNYSRTLIDEKINPAFQHPVWQIVSGGVGAPYYGRDKTMPWAKNVVAFTASKHYCLFSVAGRHVSLEVYSDTGQLMDASDNL
jgi:hypothetical protein